MTALALTPQPATASIVLEVTGAPAGAVVITRSDANGVVPVRLRTGQLPIAGALTVIDYEPALLGTVSYDVVDAANATTTGSTSLAGLVTDPQLASVQLPQLSYEPELVTGYDAGRDTGNTVLRPIGRPDPLLLLGAARMREGNLEVWCRSYDDAAAAVQLLVDGGVLMFRQSNYAGMDMYFVCSSARVEPLQATANGWRWQAVGAYLEVRPPALPLLGAAGWTFDDVAGYATFAAVRADFDDFGDLVVGV